MIAMFCYWKALQYVSVHVPVCARGLRTGNWSGAAVSGLDDHVPATGETGIQGQLLERLSQASYWKAPHCIYVSYPTNRPSPFFSQKGEQDEAVGAICESSECFCLCQSVRLAMYTYRGAMHVSLCCMPTGNTCLASLLSGPGDMELWQPCLQWATRFSSP